MTSRKAEPGNTRDRRGIIIAFILLGIGALVQITSLLVYISFLISALAIILIIRYRNFFPVKQRHTVYAGIIIFFLAYIILAFGLLTVGVNGLNIFIQSGNATVIASPYLIKAFHTFLPYLVIKTGAAYGLSYYLLVSRMLKRTDHFVYVLALGTSLALRFVLIYMVSGYVSTITPVSLKDFSEIIQTQIFGSAQLAITVVSNLLLGAAMFYVASMIAKGKIN